MKTSLAHDCKKATLHLCPCQALMHLNSILMFRAIISGDAMMLPPSMHQCNFEIGNKNITDSNRYMCSIIAWIQFFFLKAKNAVQKFLVKRLRCRMPWTLIRFGEKKIRFCYALELISIFLQNIRNAKRFPLERLHLIFLLLLEFTSHGALYLLVSPQ